MVNFDNLLADSHPAWVLGSNATHLIIKLTLLPKLLFFALKLTLWFSLKLAQKYYSKKCMFFSHMTPRSSIGIILLKWSRFYFSKGLMSTILWALRSVSFLFLKSTINYLSNKLSTDSIVNLVENLCAVYFLYKSIWNYGILLSMTSMMATSIKL